MHRVVQIIILATLALPCNGASWGADYFPNVVLTNQDGKNLKFFDDLIKNKIVMINFIFTSCPDACPLETAKLVRVQRILGDRVGKDVFFYSITIDPKNDTPKVLKAFAKKFNTGPGWQFLTGAEADITLLREKLGLLGEDASRAKKDHSLSILVGNQATGQWMKRSPMDNPYFIAAQIGSWLSNWKQPDPNQNNYADAPKIRSLTTGESLFRTRCAICHTVGQGDISNADQTLLGPDLRGVTKKRTRSWLADWIANPEKMIKEKDPLVVEMMKKYNNLPMPNLQLSKEEVTAVIEFIDKESAILEEPKQRQ